MIPATRSTDAFRRHNEKGPGEPGPVDHAIDPFLGYCPELLPGAGEVLVEPGLDELDAPPGLVELPPAGLPAPAPGRLPAPDMSLGELLELWVSLELLPLRAAPSHFAYSCGVR
jgi:hypothetical protein